jgi:hypothetical protein
MSHVTPIENDLEYLQQVAESDDVQVVFSAGSPHFVTVTVEPEQGAQPKRSASAATIAEAAGELITGFEDEEQ